MGVVVRHISILSLFVAVALLATGSNASAQAVDGTPNCTILTGNGIPGSLFTASTGFRPFSLKTLLPVARMQQAPAGLPCAGADTNTALTRASVALTDSVSVDRDNGIWGNVRAYRSSLDGGTVKDKGSTVVGAIGIDHVFGSKDEYMLGGGVAYLDADMATTPGLGGAQVSVDIRGVGPIGYFRVGRKTSERSYFRVSATAAYLFLDDDSHVRTVAALDLHPANHAGSAFIGNLQVNYQRRLVPAENLFGAVVLELRLADNRFRSPSLADRTDVSVALNAELQKEVARKVSLFLVGGVDVPLAGYELGTGDAMGLLRRPGAIFEYRTGVVYNPSEHWRLSLEADGAAASVLGELGGMFRIHYFFDRRL